MAAHAPSAAELELEWLGDERHPLDSEERQWSVQLQTSRGNIDTRYHPAHQRGEYTNLGVVYVGGAGGGLDGPARGLYPALCEQLQDAGIAGLRLHYRRPNHLADCVLDTLVGTAFLSSEGVSRVALVGHSFGGAVVISAGALSEDVAAVVPMSTQTSGTELAPQVAPRPMLLIHGDQDEILPDACSRQVYSRAQQPKELVIYPGARHGLDECREELIEKLPDWLKSTLSRT